MGSRGRHSESMREDPSPARVPPNHRQLLSPGRNSCLLLNEKNSQSASTTLQLRKLRSGVGMDTVRELEQVGSWHTPQKLRVMGEDDVAKRLEAQRRRAEAQRKHGSSTSSNSGDSFEDAGPSNWMANTNTSPDGVGPVLPPNASGQIAAKDLQSSKAVNETKEVGIGDHIMNFLFGKPEPDPSSGAEAPSGKETQKESVGLKTNHPDLCNSRDELRCCQPFALPHPQR